MCRANVSAPFGPLFLATFLAVLIGPTPALHAQAPAPGTTVAVKMMETVNSSTDPAGKQYRASVTQTVDAGRGVMIAQGAAATVTLTRSGSGYAAQLSSITISGRVVTVASNFATVSAVAQSAQANAASAVNSVLGRFGHHVEAPASAAAAAAGPHVFLPAGTTLTFVLSGSPAPAAQPESASSASSASAPNAALSSAATSGGGPGGSLTAMYICFSNPPPNPSDPKYKTEYLTAAFEVPVNTEGSIPVLEPAFSAYLKANDQYPSAGITCQPIWTVADAQGAQKKIASDRDRPGMKMVNTGWRYGQPPLTQGQSGFNPLAQGPGGLDLAQQRLTTYFCSFTAAGGTTVAVDMTKPNWNANMTTYVSQVFQADWNSAPVSMAYNVFIRDHYVHDLDLTDLSPRCTAQSPAMQTMQHQTAMISNKRIGHAVAVDFSDTAAEQAAAAHVASAPATPVTASNTSSSGGPFISCSTSGGNGFDIYVTGIFQTSKPVRHMPNGAKIVDQSVLDDFSAYLTQKGYKFKPGSNGGCDVSSTEDAAKVAQHTRIHGGSGSCGYCGNTVVETGWTE